jgi:hypothetical protein
MTFTVTDGPKYLSQSHASNLLIGCHLYDILLKTFKMEPLPSGKGSALNLNTRVQRGSSRNLLNLKGSSCVAIY